MDDEGAHLAPLPTTSREHAPVWRWWWRRQRWGLAGAGAAASAVGVSSVHLQGSSWRRPAIAGCCCEEARRDSLARFGLPPPLRGRRSSRVTGGLRRWPANKIHDRFGEESARHLSPPTPVARPPHFVHTKPHTQIGRKQGRSAWAQPVDGFGAGAWPLCVIAQSSCYKSLAFNNSSNNNSRRHDHCFRSSIAVSRRNNKTARERLGTTRRARAADLPDAGATTVAVAFSLRGGGTCSRLVDLRRSSLISAASGEWRPCQPDGQPARPPAGPAAYRSTNLVTCNKTTTKTKWRRGRRRRRSGPRSWRVVVVEVVSFILGARCSRESAWETPAAAATLATCVIKRAARFGLAWAQTCCSSVCVD
jgi:hypothetical protein